MVFKSQKKVWNAIAKDWKSFRKNPIPEVQSFLKKQKGKVLDLGSGSGRHLQKIKDGKMYLADFSIKMIQLAKINIQQTKVPAELIISNSTNLPFKDNFFDSAIFINTLHCIKGERARKKSLKEIYRVLKTKSHALISVWSRKQKRIKNKPKQVFIPWTIGSKKYQRYTYIYDKEELQNLLKEIGFKILKTIDKDNLLIYVQKPN